MSEQPTTTDSSTETDLDADKSILDTVLDLDALLSADVRRAEGTAWLYKRADLGGRLDVLARELEEAEAREASGIKEQSVGDRTAAAIRAEREALRAEYRKSGVPIPVRQMVAIDWEDFKRRHADALSTAVTVYDLPTEVANELIARSMVTVTPTTVEKVAAMRQTFGWPALSDIAARAWEVNQNAGVSVPK